MMFPCQERAGCELQNGHTGSHRVPFGVVELRLASNDDRLASAPLRTAAHEQLAHLLDAAEDGHSIDWRPLHEAVQRVRACKETR